MQYIHATLAMHDEHVHVAAPSCMRLDSRIHVYIVPRMQVPSLRRCILGMSSKFLLRQRSVKRGRASSRSAPRYFGISLDHCGQDEHVYMCCSHSRGDFHTCMFNMAVLTIAAALLIYF